MLQLTPAQYGVLAEMAAHEAPGPVVLGHVIHTGYGGIWVDRFPAPRAIIAECATNYALSGDPQAVAADDLRALIRGFVAAPPAWLPALEAAFTGVTHWPRIILELKDTAPLERSHDLDVRRLSASDVTHVASLSPESIWVAKTWGGPAGLAASGHAWGAFVEGRLVSVASSFFMGSHYEDLAVATEPGFARRGLSSACASALCAGVRERGHCATWSTSPDNLASLRVAQKLGFSEVRRDWLYVIGIAVPAP